MLRRNFLSDLGFWQSAEVTAAGENCLSFYDFS